MEKTIKMPYDEYLSITEKLTTLEESALKGRDRVIVRSLYSFSGYVAYTNDEFIKKLVDEKKTTLEDNKLLQDKLDKIPNFIKKLFV